MFNNLNTFNIKLFKIASENEQTQFQADKLYLIKQKYILLQLDINIVNKNKGYCKSHSKNDWTE